MLNLAYFQLKLSLIVAKGKTFLLWEDYWLIYVDLFNRFIMFST